MKSVVIALVACTACKAISPPPMLAMHADTAAEPRESTTIMVIIGIAGTFLGGGGWGVALRGEHQVTGRTAIGIELTAGKGDEAQSDKNEDKDERKHTLFAFRGYGRFSPRTHDSLAATYGAGLTLMDTGLLAVTAHAGGVVGYSNDSATPLLQLGLAVSQPILDGKPFGDAKRIPEGDVFITADVGLFATPEDGRLSLDIGVAGALNSGELVLSGSLGAGETF